MRLILGALNLGEKLYMPVEKELASRYQDVADPSISRQNCFHLHYHCS